MKACEGRQMKYVRRGSWRVLDRDEFLNITIKVFFELFIFVLELNQVRQSPSQGLAHFGLGTITVVPMRFASFLKTGDSMEMSLRAVDSFAMMLPSSAYARPLISGNFPNMRPQRCRVTRQNVINSGQSP